MCPLSEEGAAVTAVERAAASRLGTSAAFLDSTGQRAEAIRRGGALIQVIRLYMDGFSTLSCCMQSILKQAHEVRAARGSSSGGRDFVSQRLCVSSSFLGTLDRLALRACSRNGHASCCSSRHSQEERQRQHHHHQAPRSRCWWRRELAKLSDRSSGKVLRR